MSQKILAAKAATTTDRGEFTAIAAAYSVDRAGDRIVPGAFSKTIARWQASGKQVPIHWDHRSDPDDIIGAVDPATMEEAAAGLLVAGRIDLEGSEKGREAWRSMKAGSMSLSFGYMVVEQTKTAEANELHELDLFEISVVPAPANPDTRFLALKSLPDEIGERIAELHKRIDEIEARVEGEPPEPPEEKAEDVEDDPGASQQASDPEADQFQLERLQAFQT